MEVANLKGEIAKIHFQNEEIMNDEEFANSLNKLSDGELLELHLDLCREINRIRDIVLNAGNKNKEK